jgi:hypothetical protein
MFLVAKEDFFVALRGLGKDPCLLMLIHMLATQIHWFSIFNSFMMVIFLTGLVSMILMRTLRNDYAKYAREEDDLETLVSKTILNHNL